MKDAYYFPHDANARHDDRILAVRMKYGMRGYGIYFALIEMLREANGYQRSSKPEAIASIAFELREEVEIIKDLLDNYSLFARNLDSEMFWSESLKRRMEAKERLSRKRAKSGKVGGLSKAKNALAKAKQTASKPLAIAKQMPSSKGEESKGEESKGEERDTDIAVAPPKKQPGHVALLEGMKACYEENAGLGYQLQKKDFVLAAELVKKHGVEAVRQKIEWLAVYCSGKSEAWFARAGWADFTIGKVSACWNQIIPRLSEGQKAEVGRELEQKKREEHEAKVQEMLARTK